MCVTFQIKKKKAAQKQTVVDGLGLDSPKDRGPAKGVIVMPFPLQSSCRMFPKRPLMWKAGPALPS